MANKRLLKELKELKDLQNDDTIPFSAALVDEDLFHWEAAILGSPDSPYEGGVFHLDVKIPQDYPFDPPKIVFTTRVFHPCIDSNGRIWIDTVDDKWNPAQTIPKLLLLICSILTDTNFVNVLNPEMAKLYKTDRAKYESTARSWTQKYAMG